MLEATSGRWRFLRRGESQRPRRRGAGTRVEGANFKMQSHGLKVAHQRQKGARSHSQPASSWSVLLSAS